MNRIVVEQTGELACAMSSYESIPEFFQRKRIRSHGETVFEPTYRLEEVPEVVIVGKRARRRKVKV